MLSKKQGFPEESELVLCTVTSVQFHSVFVNIDEYDKGGMIHISEVSPGRIRNIRDFVKEGKKILCKVLRVNQEKGYIDLSLRRVNEAEKRRKIDGIKREQNAEKIIENTAGKIGMGVEQLYREISEKMKASSLHEFFESAVSDESVLEKLGIDKKHLEVLSETIKQRIKVPEVTIKGRLKITSYAPDGMDVIKGALKSAEEAAKGRVSINYMGSGIYRFVVTSDDYKRAEKIMKSATESAISYAAKRMGTAEFSRESA